MRGVNCNILRFAFCFLPVCTVFLFAAPCYGGSRPESSAGAGQGQIAAPAQKNGTQAGESPNVQPDQYPLQQGTLVFTGISGRLSSREDAVKAAVEDAARKLSFFHSVSGHSVKREYVGGGALDFNVNSEYRLEYDRDLERYINELEYDPATDIFEINNAVLVVAKAAYGPASNTPGPAMPHAPGHSFGNERPRWIDAPPAEINGFAVGVGFSARLSSYRDTVVRSYEKAVIAIIENMGSRVSGENQNYQNNYSAFGFDMNYSNKTNASGALRNFYIIESWTDPVNLSVWTLGVANGEDS